MTVRVDPAGLAEAGQQLARGLLTGPVPQLHVAHRSVTGISEPSTPTELLDEIRVDAGLGAWAAHAVLPVPGGAL
jgi:hypothetical protein